MNEGIVLLLKSFSKQKNIEFFYDKWCADTLDTIFNIIAFNESMNESDDLCLY